MSQNSKIEWTDRTWNPVVGCRACSPGCAHCYAETMSNRLAAMAKKDIADGKDPGRKRGYLNVIQDGGWRGNVQTVPEALGDPLKWRSPQKVFVNSMSDLFYGDDADRRACESKGIPFEPVPFEFIDQVFAVMALTPRHTYQILTKRTGRMAEYTSDPTMPGRIYRLINDWLDDGEGGFLGKYYDEAHNVTGWRTEGDPTEPEWILPLPNVWLGTSVENQAMADKRIPELLQVPAAVRFLSCEPLLGLVDLSQYLRARQCSQCGQEWDAAACGPTHAALKNDPGIHWAIVGGESGPGARPMHPDWARSIRNQCVAAGVPFFFKQWGEWAPGENAENPSTRTEQTATWFDDRWQLGTLTPKQSEELHYEDQPALFRLGKKSAGRLLDGRTWAELPTVKTQAETISTARD